MTLICFPIKWVLGVVGQIWSLGISPSDLEIVSPKSYSKFLAHWMNVKIFVVLIINLIYYYINGVTLIVGNNN